MFSVIGRWFPLDAQSKRIVIKWRNEWSPEMKKEGFFRCTFDLEQTDEAVKLTIIHEIDVLNSKLIEAVAGGWPFVLSNLKTLLETGNIVSKEFKKQDTIKT